MRKLSAWSPAAWLSFGVVGALAVLEHPSASAQPDGGPKYDNPATWVAPEYSGRPLAPNDAAYGDIDGKHLWQYVKEQADISRRYRDSGHPQYWGRISGTSGDVESEQWMLGKFRQIGLTNVHSQSIAYLNPEWAPTLWEVSAVSGSRTVKLTSAQPPYGTESTDGKVLDLPVVYVGLGSEADYAGRDVRGKAVLFVKGDPPLMYNIGSQEVLRRAQERGAAAIFSTDLRGGNFKAIAYHLDYKMPIFNLGTEDALAVRDMIAKAPANDPPHVRIRLDATWVSGQKSALVWGTLQGATDETIYVLAHRDGWFDGSGDNASGVSVMLGLAEHFAKIPQPQRRRTIIFVGLDGHHNEPIGDYGTTWMYENRQILFSKTALLINSEHPAEAIAHTGMTGRTDAVMPMWWYAGGPARPQLEKIAHQAWQEFGVPLWVEPVCPIQGEHKFVRSITTDNRGTVAYPCRSISGDMHPFWRDVPAVIAQSSDFTYMHTDADSPDIIPWPGLEAAARAYARIVDQVNKLALSDLQRPAETPAYVPRLRKSECAAWIKDSSVTCNPETKK